MQLNSFNLELYDKNKIDHKTTIIKLCNDLESYKYLGDLEKISNIIEKFYITYHNNKPIGFISFNIHDNINEIKYGIIPEYRNKHLATQLLQEFTQYLLEVHSEIVSLDLIINKLNIGSKKVAISSGYTKETKYKYSRRR